MKQNGIITSDNKEELENNLKYDNDNDNNKTNNEDNKKYNNRLIDNQLRHLMRENKLDKMKDIVDKYDFDINYYSDEFNDTLIYYACKLFNFDAVKWCIDNFIDSKIINKCYNLMMSTFKNNEEYFKEIEMIEKFKYINVYLFINYFLQKNEYIINNFTSKIKINTNNTAIYFLDFKQTDYKCSCGTYFLKCDSGISCDYHVIQCYSCRKNSYSNKIYQLNKLELLFCRKCV